MKAIIATIFNLVAIDDLAKKTSLIHTVNPVVKLLLALFYVIAVVSYDNYQISILIPFIIILYFVLLFSNLSISNTFKKLLFLELFVVAFALFNALFSNQYIEVGHYKIYGGIITFFSIMLKSSLSLLMMIILTATTGINNIIRALAFLRLPKVFITILFLLHRYIWILLEEVYNTTLASELRCKTTNNSGLSFKIWGSLTGQILIRTYERGIMLYNAMNLRGFNINQTQNYTQLKFKSTDYLLLFLGAIILVLFKTYNITEIIGNITLSVL